MSLIETHKTRSDWKTILNVPLNEPHKTTLRPDETRFLHYSGMDLTYVQILFGIN